jgi:hypothetical protein
MLLSANRHTQLTASFRVGVVAAADGANRVAGLNWLYALHTQKLNGILADESTLPSSLNAPHTEADVSLGVISLRSGSRQDGPDDLSAGAALA